LRNSGSVVKHYHLTTDMTEFLCIPPGREIAISDHLGEESC
jgi:hypothetical protein